MTDTVGLFMIWSLAVFLTGLYGALLFMIALACVRLWKERKWRR